MATLYELRSSYEKQLEQEQAIIDLRQQYKDLLTGSLTAAQQQYQQTAQTAATQASYDISGAYANYLKQQRNIAAQGQLETGYKEELGDVLTSQYGSAYQQARATQATTAAKAYETYLKSAEQAYATQTENKELVDKLVQERASRAATFDELYRQFRGIENPDLLESSVYNPATGEYPVYAMDEKTGEYKLTEFGKNWYAEGLIDKVDFTNNNGETRAMSFEDWLKESGDEKQIEDWQKYAGEIMKDVAGIEYSKNEKGALILPEYDEAMGKETKLKTEGYIESIGKPAGALQFDVRSFDAIGWGKEDEQLQSAMAELVEYSRSVGLTDDEMAGTIKEWVKNNEDALVEHVLGVAHRNEQGTKSRVRAVFQSFINSDGATESIKKFFYDLGRTYENEVDWSDNKTSVNELYDYMLDAIATRAKTKYTGA